MLGDKLILKTRTKIQQLRLKPPPPPAPPSIIKISGYTIPLEIKTVVSTQTQTSGQVAQKGQPETKPCIQRVNMKRRWFRVSLVNRESFQQMIRGQLQPLGGEGGEMSITASHHTQKSIQMDYEVKCERHHFKTSRKEHRRMSLQSQG